MKKRGEGVGGQKKSGTVFTKDAYFSVGFVQELTGGMLKDVQVLMVLLKGEISGVVNTARKLLAA